MKRKIFSYLLIALFFIPLSLSAQTSPVDVIIEKYGDEDGFTTVLITEEMFALFANIETDEEGEDFNNLMKGLQSIKIITFDNSEGKKADLNFYKSLQADLSSEEYTELMSIKEKDQDIKFFIRRLETGKIGEMIMVSGGDGDNTLISIKGDIDLNDMSDLSHSLGIKGLDHLEDMELHEQEMEKHAKEMEEHEKEMEKMEKEFEKQQKEMEKQIKEMEKQMKELEEEKRK